MGKLRALLLVSRQYVKIVNKVQFVIQNEIKLRLSGADSPKLLTDLDKA